MITPRRKVSRRILKSFDLYVISFGSAGFAVIERNGRRITPMSTRIELKKRKRDR